MHFTKGENELGQILVIMTVGIVALLSLAALAIDGGLYFVNRRSAQNAADSAALAGVLAKYNGEDCQTKAIERASSNGFEDSEDVDVEVNCNYGDDGNFVYVTIISTNGTILAGLIGQDEFTSQVEAEAYYYSSGTSISSNYTGGALIALDPSNENTFTLSGNSKLTVENGGVFVNSSNSKAWTGSGNQTFTTDTGINVVGGVSLSGNMTLATNITAGKSVRRSGNFTITGTIKENQAMTAISYPPAELVIAAPIVTPPTCSNTGTSTTSGSTVTLTPGNHSARTISGNYTVIFQPGDYCFSGDLTISGNSTVTANNVNFNMGSNDISISGNMTFTASNSLFYLGSGSFIMNGNSKINFPNSTIYIESGNFTLNGNDAPSIISDKTSIIYLGSGNIKFNGNSTFTSTNTVFFLNSGSMTWNGNTKLVLDAPDDGDYAGLLIYMPYTNTSTMTINGNSSASLTGSIIAPGAAIKINGNSNTTSFNSRIIGYTFSFIGNTKMLIDFDEDENYDVGGAGNSYIELTK